jgi:hypothetical protein
MTNRRFLVGFTALATYILSARGHAREGQPQTPPGASCHEDGPAAAVLARFHEAVEETLFPRLDEDASTFPSLERAVAQLAEQHLAPARAQLHERAVWRLRCLPDARLPNFAGWEKEVLPMGNRGNEVRLYDVASMGGIFLEVGWDPVSAAETWKNVILTRSLTVSGMGKVGYLRRFAPLEPAAVDRNADHPVVALVGAREVFVVQLRSDLRGYYAPERIDWYRKYPHPAKVPPPH